MGGALPAGPHSAGLWALIRDHRPALEYDWRTRFGLGLTPFLRREMTWAEAWALTSQILRDPDSHTVASLLDWSYVPGSARQIGVDLFEGYLNAHRGKHTRPQSLPRPWATGTTPDTGPLRPLTEEDRAQRALLDDLLFGRSAAEPTEPEGGAMPSSH